MHIISKHSLDCINFVVFITTNEEGLFVNRTQTLKPMVNLQHYSLCFLVVTVIRSNCENKGENSILRTYWWI